MKNQLILMQEKTNKALEINNLKTKLRELSDELDTFVANKDADILQAEQDFIANETDRIHSEHRDNLINIQASIDKLGDDINKYTVDESDEAVKELCEKREYLNQVAVEVEKLLDALLSVSNDYFVSVAKTDRKISYTKYVKELNRIDAYVIKIKQQAFKEMFPIRVNNLLVEVVPKNIAIYLTGIVTGVFAVVLFPYYLYKAVNRARVLHLFSEKYHILTCSAIDLQDLTSAEIAEVLEGVIQTKKATLNTELEELEERLEQEEAAQQKEIEGLKFDREQMEALMEQRKDQIENDIAATRAQLERATQELDIITEELQKFIDEMSAKFERERAPYLDVHNENRFVTFPTRMLYEDLHDKGNKWTKLVPGLYLYKERAQAEQFARLMTYELRNYLQYGALRVYFLDVTMGMYVSDMVFDPPKDIIIEPMKEDHEARVTVIHDLLRRRLAAVKPVAADLNQYNTVQVAAGSTPMSFEVIFYFLEGASTLTEKIIQLLGVGETLGIYLILFLNQELLTPENIKMYEKYVGTVVEISSSGVSSSNPKAFRETFEAALKNQS